MTAVVKRWVGETVARRGGLGRQDDHLEEVADHRRPVVGLGVPRPAVEVGQADVRKRCAQAPRVVEFPRVTERHRARAIDDEIDAEIFFLFVETHQQLAEALVDVPIDVEKVVAFDVVTMIGELDAAALLFGAPFCPLAPGEHAPADDGERLQLALEIVAEEIFLLDARTRPEPA